MVDPGDTVSATLKKEFGEEALNSLELSGKEQEKLHGMLTKLFQKGQTVSSFGGKKTWLGNNVPFPEAWLGIREQYLLVYQNSWSTLGNNSPLISL